MTALCITGGILLFFTLIALIRVEAVISYGEEFGLTVIIAGIPVKIIPKKSKKVKIRDYTPAAMAKKQKKAEKAALVKAKKKAEKEEKKKKEKERKKTEEAERKASGQKKEKKDIIKIIKLITGLCEVLFKRFGKHIRIRVARLHINVAGSDAAQTAILYGGVSQAVGYLAELLCNTGTLRHPAKADVSVIPDWISEKTSTDIEIGISLCVWQVFDMINRTGARFIKELVKSNGKLF